MTKTLSRIFITTPFSTIQPQKEEQFIPRTQTEYCGMLTTIFLLTTQEPRFQLPEENLIQTSMPFGQTIQTQQVIQKEHKAYTLEQLLLQATAQQTQIQTETFYTIPMELH